MMMTRRQSEGRRRRGGEGRRGSYITSGDYLDRTRWWGGVKVLKYHVSDGEYFYQNGGPISSGVWIKRWGLKCGRKKKGGLRGWVLCGAK